VDGGHDGGVGVRVAGVGHNIELSSILLVVVVGCAGGFWILDVLMMAVAKRDKREIKERIFRSGAKKMHKRGKEVKGNGR